VVNDGSSDKTGEILKKCKVRFPSLRIIENKVNLGYAKALAAGIKGCFCSWALLMDADGQFDIREIGKFTPYLTTHDIIIGYRKDRKDSFFRISLGKAYQNIARFLLGLYFKDLNCGFKLIKKEKLETAEIFSRGGIFYAELITYVKYKGLSIKEIPVCHFRRKGGSGKGASFNVVLYAVLDLVRLLAKKRRLMC